MMRDERIAKALGGRKNGRGWTARCPAHDDRSPSLSIGHGRNGQVLVHCHAGCDQDLVIAALRSRGLWADSNGRPDSQVSQVFVKHNPEPDDIKRSEAALEIWKSAQPAQGTLVEIYLASRGIQLAPPIALRFHPVLTHPSGLIVPARVGLVTRGSDHKPLAIHRTFLAPNGIGKAAVAPQKMMLGPCRGGAVRLAEPGEVLTIGEGVETCLAAMQATGHPAWAALSTSGLLTLDLPPNVRDLIVLADGDDPGERAAQTCARRWKDQGRRVRIARPPQGTDFNDLLLAGPLLGGVR